MEDESKSPTHEEVEAPQVIEGEVSQDEARTLTKVTFEFDDGTIDTLEDRPQEWVTEVSSSVRALSHYDWKTERKNEQKN